MEKRLRSFTNQNLSSENRETLRMSLRTLRYMLTASNTEEAPKNEPKNSSCTDSLEIKK